MWETAAFGAGFLLVAAGALSLIYPLRWIGVRTRFAALVAVTAGFFVVALGAKMLDSYLVYLGLALAFLGFISMMWPLRFVFIRSRRVASLVFAFGVLLATAVSLLPYREKHAATATAKLDDWMPRWQVGERHSIEIAAPPEKVFVAIHAVRVDEISFFRTLTAIRRCGQDGPENILNAPEQKPILDVATETTFVLLDDDAPREIVIGTVIAAPKEFRTSSRLTPEIFRKGLRPGAVLATMNFLITSNASGGSIVTTETRVYANSPAALRQFGIYWRLIHPGSDLIRRMWLHAIARRAEAAAR